MPSWLKLKSVELDPEGTPDPNGVGAVRNIRNGPVKIKEEVTLFEPPHRLGYRMVSGLPVKDYLGMTTLEAQGGGTKITWEVDYVPDMPAGNLLIRWLVKRIVDDLVKRLAQHTSQPA